MKLFTAVVIATIFIGCSEKHKSVESRFQNLGEITKDDGTYLGTLIGAKNSKGLLSEIIVVRKSGSLADTVYRVDEIGFHNQNGLEAEASTKDYDGWNIEFKGKDQFDVWLVKINGPASDGATIQWVDSLRSFALQYAP